MNIYVGNLSYSTNSDGLKKVFEQYGAVSSATVITDKVSGRSKGFGFVEMPEESAAINAINSINGHEVDGRTLTVNKAKERENNY
jgi:RNA recognition motif-containing protein